MKYYYFDLWVGDGQAGVYPTRARSETQGEVAGELSLDPDSEEMCGALARLREGDMDEPFLCELGGRLFESLFRGAVGNHFQRSLGEVARDDDVGVRIRLKIDPPEISALPWELAYDRERDCFLATSAETPLTRYIEVARPIKALHTRPPIKVLVVAPGGSGLDVGGEVRAITGALGGLGDAVTVKLLDGRVTSSDIDRELTMEEFHVFHFIGHGGFRDGEGCLLLNDEQDEHDLVTARRFAYFFQDYPCMKLVVLNSCLGAESSTSALTGVAQRLVVEGLPAVIAMRHVVEDEVAKLFAESFYLKLCAGYERGRVDTAVSHARKRLRQEYGAHLGFSTPVLFMRSPTGVIFDIAQEEPPKGRPLRELHTLNEVKSTLKHNIATLKLEGGVEAAAEIEREQESLARVRGRVRNLYNRVVISALPRLTAFVLLASLALFVAAHTNIFNVFFLDDLVQVRARRWLKDTQVNTLSPEVKIIIAEREGNGPLLGDPYKNPAWRAHHTTVLRALTDAGARVVAFDLTFPASAPAHDDAFAEEIRRAQSQNTHVIAAQSYKYQSQEFRNLLTPKLKDALGDNWGNDQVGLLGPQPFGSDYIFIDAYQVAAVRPASPDTDGDAGRLVPSLALQAVIKSREGAAPLTPSFDEGAQTLTLGGGLQPVPVANRSGSLDMILDNVLETDLRDAITNYVDVYAWAISGAPEHKIDLETRFKDAIVLIGYRTDDDTFAIIGHGQRSGVEIHANVVSNILKGVYVRRLPWLRNFLIIAAMLTLGIFLQTRLRRWASVRVPIPLPNVNRDLGIPVLLLAAVVVYLIIVYEVYRSSRVTFDISYHIAALIVGYIAVKLFRKQLTRSPGEEDHVPQA